MELLDVYDDNGNITGEYVERGPKTKELEPHKHIAICVIFIENSKHQFLIQKTSEEKDSVFASTGGHVDKGETPSNSIIREVKEELGIDISNDNVESLGFVRYERPLWYLYYLNKDIDINDIHVQEEEVQSVQYMSIDEINKLIENNQMRKSHEILFKELLNRKNKRAL